MRPLFVAPALGSLLALCFVPIITSSALAGGVIFTRGGEYLPQREQEAYIDWHAGRQKLYLGTLARPTTEASVWIVPVPGSPDETSALAVDIYPFVPLAKPAVGLAREKLESLRLVSLALDSGLLCITLRAPSRFSTTLADYRLEDTSVHHKLMAEGMQVERISARSPEPLEEYLRRHGFPTDARALEALEPYRGKKYTFVCGFLEAGAEPAHARALAIDFPTDTIFYPLGSTAVQEEAALAALMVVGWHELPDSDVRASYLQVVPFSDEPDPDELKAGAEITRIVLTGSPSNWGGDLYFVPATPVGVRFARFLDDLRGWFFLLVPGGLGVLLSVTMPLLLFEPAERRRIDFGFALAVGVAISLSIYASAVVFYIWCRARLSQESGESDQESGIDGAPGESATEVAGEEEIESQPVRGWGPVRWGLALALGTLMCTAVLFEELPLETPLEMVGGAVMILSSLALPAATLFVLYSAARGHIAWLIVFATLHFSSVCLLTLLLSAWLARFA